MRAQGILQRGQAGDIANALRHRCPIEIRSQPDVILAQFRNQMVQVLQHRLPAHIGGLAAIGAQKDSGEVQAHHPL